MRMMIMLKISLTNRITQQTIHPGKSSVANLLFMIGNQACFTRLLSLSSKRTYGKRTVPGLL